MAQVTLVVNTGQKTPAPMSVVNDRRCHVSVIARSLDAADAEWALLAACHNHLKLFGHTGTNGLAELSTRRQADLDI